MREAQDSIWNTPLGPYKQDQESRYRPWYMTTTVLGPTNTHCEPKGTVADIFSDWFKVHQQKK